MKTNFSHRHALNLITLLGVAWFALSCESKSIESSVERDKMIGEITQQIDQLKINNEEIKNAAKLLQDDFTKNINVINRKILELNKSIESLEITFGKFGAEKEIVFESSARPPSLFFLVCVSLSVIVLIGIFIKLRLDKMQVAKRKHAVSITTTPPQGSPDKPSSTSETES